MASEVSRHQTMETENSLRREILGAGETFDSAERLHVYSAGFWLEEGSAEQHSFCLFLECFE